MDINKEEIHCADETIGTDACKFLCDNYDVIDNVWTATNMLYHLWDKGESGREVIKKDIKLVKVGPDYILMCPLNQPKDINKSFSNTFIILAFLVDGVWTMKTATVKEEYDTGYICDGCDKQHLTKGDYFCGNCNHDLCSACHAKFDEDRSPISASHSFKQFDGVYFSWTNCD